MYIDSKRGEECCGCTACASICPRNAIEMKEDDHGFSYPVVNKNICIHCNLCRDVCAFQNNGTSLNSFIQAYAVQHNSEVVRRKSRSGGAFYLLAEKIIKYGGIVWGAAFDGSLAVVHTKADSIESLSRLQGSKYVQSDLRMCFTEIEEELKLGETVLFSGTACQVAGLNNYVKLKCCDATRLYTCDVVCQGVPTPLVYKEYLHFLEQRYHNSVEVFNFRDKSRLGWGAHEESFKIKGDSKKHFSRCYATLFYSHLALRESCFECKYTQMNRPADITLADFWKADKYPEFSDEIGNSMVMINSEKGFFLFSKAATESKFISIEKEECLQPRLLEPNKKPAYYDEFWNMWEEIGPFKCIEKYGKESYKSKLIYIIKPLLKR